jgi:hypothetical protein
VARPVLIDWGAGRSALATSVERADDLDDALASVKLTPPRPVIVVVGGAAGLSDVDIERLAPLAEELVRVAEQFDSVLVDGGTDSGVMRLLGRAVSRHDDPGPLVGVVVKDLVTLPGGRKRGDGAVAEPNHTHFVLVPGSQWGDESPWISRVATSIAGPQRSVTVLVNGGEIAWRDVAESVTTLRPVVVVADTGRAADQLASAVERGSPDERTEVLVASGLLSVATRGPGPQSLAARLRELLGDPLERMGEDGN